MTQFGGKRIHLEMTRFPRCGLAGGRERSGGFGGVRARSLIVDALRRRSGVLATNRVVFILIGLRLVGVYLNSSGCFNFIRDIFSFSGLDKLSCLNFHVRHDLKAFFVEFNKASRHQFLE